MNQLKIISKTISSIVLIAVFLFTTSCKKQDPAPNLPPQESFVMDFNNFNDGSNKTANTDSTFQNHTFAGLNVLVWNIVLTVNLIVPVAAFTESFNHEAVWDRQTKTYAWEYSFKVANVTHSARLEGAFEGDDQSKVNWKMYISKTGGFTDVLWFTGTTANDGSSAQWTINKDANDPTAYLQVDYSKSTESDAEIRYSNVLEGDEGKGSYINFEVTSSGTFDRFYDIYLIKTDNLIEIEWNSTNRSGQVRNEKHFGDILWRCWDENLEDAVCQ